MYGYDFMLELEGKSHGTFSWKIDTQITQHTSINELSAVVSCPWGPGE